MTSERVAADVFTPEECTWPDCGCEDAERLRCAVDPPPVGHPISNAVRDLRLIRDMAQLAEQYRLDLQHPPAPDSRLRRVEAIDELLARVAKR